VSLPPSLLRFAAAADAVLCAQVAHLNSKIAEDSEEISRKSAELESLKTESKDKVCGGPIKIDFSVAVLDTLLCFA